MVCPNRFNNTERNVFETEENANQWQPETLHLIYIIGSESTVSVEKQKRAAPTWVHVISMPAHTLTLTHSHILHWRALAKKKSAHEIYKARTHWNSNRSSSFMLSTPKCTWVTFPPPTAFYTQTEPVEVTLQETCWMCKAKLIWGNTSASIVGMKWGRLII